MLVREHSLNPRGPEREVHRWLEPGVETGNDVDGSAPVQSEDERIGRPGKGLGSWMYLGSSGPTVSMEKGF